MTYRIQWAQLADDEAVGGLKRLAGVRPTDAPDLKSLVVEILRSCGGFPFLESDKQDPAAMVQAILHGAIKHTLSGILGPKIPRVRYHLVDAKSQELKRIVASVVPLDINRESGETLKKRLPLGAKVVKEIEAERNRRGPYRDLRDLATRVKGIGPEKAAKLSTYLKFDSNDGIVLKSFAIVNRFKEDFATLLNLQTAAEPKDKLISAFRLVLNACLMNPNPYNRQFRARPFTKATLPALRPGRFAGNLFREEYLAYVRDAIAGARKSINVAIFHIALGSKGHPTRGLLDGLIAAHKRGIAVRVLVDMDRDTDPYLSTLINSKAKKYLETAGVAVKYDSAQKLFHSKFLTVDDDLSVIGSHNWTIGSLENVDDLSIVIHSKALNQDLRKRFDAIYA